MWNPLVSIVIPVYNGSNYLKEAIDSALKQTYKNIEIIVVNDGSNDEDLTEKIALSYGDRIRYFSKLNGGVATALNLAIEKMRGEYFSWLSHDDLYYSFKIEKQIDALRQEKNKKKIVYSNYDILNMKLNKKYVKVLDLQERPKEKYLQNVYPVIEGFINGCSLLIHKSHFERVGVFDDKLKTTQDYDLWFRMFRGQQLLYIEDSLSILREHAEQGSKTIEIHKEECDVLYKGFVESLTKDEICFIYENEYIFYYKMLRLAERRSLLKMEDVCVKKLQNLEVPNFIVESKAKIKKEMQKFANQNDLPICIFGAGRNGNQFCREFKRWNLNVVAFVDNDPIKWGKYFQNIICKSPQQLIKEKEKFLVVISMQDCGEVEKQLTSFGLPYVIGKKQMDVFMESLLLP